MTIADILRKIKAGIDRRKDLRLRKWCVRHTQDSCYVTPESVYEFILSQRSRSSQKDLRTDTGDNAPGRQQS